jgi:uncharacterized protein with PQ loop repeat
MKMEMRRRRLPQILGATANIAGIGGLLVFYGTQVVTVFTQRNVSGLSLPAFIALLIGCVGLIGTSIKAHSRALEAVNLVGAGCTGATIVAIIMWQ